MKYIVNNRQLKSQAFVVNAATVIMSRLISKLQQHCSVSINDTDCISFYKQLCSRHI